jgi:hypothetical protein
MRSAAQPVKEDLTPSALRNTGPASVSATRKSQSELRVCKIGVEALSPKMALMKSPRRLQRISTGISLIVLSLAFSLLGLISFFNKLHADLAQVSSVDYASWIAGSLASLLVGTTFLAACCVYWRRYP